MLVVSGLLVKMLKIVEKLSRLYGSVTIYGSVAGFSEAVQNFGDFYQTCIGKLRKMSKIFSHQSSYYAASKKNLRKI